MLMLDSDDNLLPRKYWGPGNPPVDPESVGT